MIRISIVALVGLACGAVPASAQKTEAGVRAFSAAEVPAVLKRDTAAIEAMFADDLLVNAPNNMVHDKATVMGFLRTPGRIDYTAFERTIDRVAIDGDRAIIMGGEVVVDRIGPLAGRRVHRRFTDLLRWEGGRWRMYARHANVIAPGTPNAPGEVAPPPR